jgi:selenocysteine-specific elongation factor
MPDVVPYILATAGHVDHGKSALVRALTGVDPDRLPEEKARGITIDLGFAALDLAGPDGQTVRLGVVDVPGHEDFVKNMVAGIGSVDLALLVVAADDGWMPQTEEHLQILAYQGVTRGLVAVTKVDLATEEDATIEAVRDRLQGSPLAGAAIVATSVVTGRGLDDLRAALAAAAVAGPPPSDVGKPRLPVDRAFALRGVGTVVTGTLTGGTLSRGQAVVARPGSAGGKIRSLQSHNRDAPVARPGSRVAVNVPELAGVGRGAVVTLATLEGPPLAHAARVFVHHGTAAVAGRVYLLDRASPMVPGQAGLAQLRLESPVYAWAGDRMVLRDAQQRHTLAGGRVLDPAAARRGYNRERRRATLALRAGSPDDATVMAAAELADHAVLGRASVLVRSQFGYGGGGRPGWTRAGRPGGGRWTARGGRRAVGRVAGGAGGCGGRRASCPAGAHWRGRGGSAGGGGGRRGGSGRDRTAAGGAGGWPGVRPPGGGGGAGGAPARPAGAPGGGGGAGPHRAGGQTAGTAEPP